MKSFGVVDAFERAVAEFAGAHKITLLTKPFTTKELEAVLEQLA